MGQIKDIVCTADFATINRPSCTAALEWFKEHCSLNASMEANKAELKEKIAEAKTTGERANKSR